MNKNKLSNLIIVTLILNIVLLLAISFFYRYELKKNIEKDAVIVNMLGKIRGNIQRYTKFKIINNKKYKKIGIEINTLFKEVNSIFLKDNKTLSQCKKQFLYQLKHLKLTWNEIEHSQKNLISLSEIAWREANILIAHFEHIHKLKFNNLIKDLNLFIYISIAFLSLITLIVYTKIKKGLEIDIVTDELTKLYNRLFFNKQYHYLVTKYERFKTPFSMVIIDIDNFKKINDTYGHKKGDKILKEVAQVIKDSIRRTDLAFRYGGEEIVVLLPDTELDKAKKIADRIRKNIEQKVKIQNNSVTISAGVGMYNGGNSHEFFKKVDKALYMAKKSGKNKVIIAPS